MSFESISELQEPLNTPNHLTQAATALVAL